MSVAGLFKAIFHSFTTEEYLLRFMRLIKLYGMSVALSLSTYPPSHTSQGGTVHTFNDVDDIFVEFEIEEECMLMQNLRNDRGVLEITKASNFKKKVKQ
ncbi:hypothetical protein E3P99_03040 [Wallemia hederae]|uniref:Uncharacterized protein n=1 Tax=Wallemia hederae TaxID=1540922 RepID=A0A4V4LSS5_9BASI|nr:hypothetical protein E3P99_03040 [Wallemia hederae]